MNGFPFIGERHQSVDLPVSAPKLRLSISFDQGTRRFIAFLEHREEQTQMVAMAFVPEGDVPRVSTYSDSSRQMLHLGGAAFPVNAEASDCLDQWLLQLQRLNLQTASPNPALCRVLGGAR
ncbi:hypothetical protein SN15_14640 [Stenotrophomonas maltophilia]|nr:hypothetical protein SN15_14640 [Stenotrophomonas maltophilia]